MDPHRNIFYFYRGQTKNRNGLVLDTQLENNTTKALYNVLEHSDRSQVLKPFLKQFLKVTPPTTLDEVHFALQRRDIDRPDIQSRFVVTICDKPRFQEDALQT